MKITEQLTKNEKEINKLLNKLARSIELSTLKKVEELRNELNTIKHKQILVKWLVVIAHDDDLNTEAKLNSVFKEIWGKK